MKKLIARIKTNKNYVYHVDVDYTVTVKHKADGYNIHNIYDGDSHIILIDEFNVKHIKNIYGSDVKLTQELEDLICEKIIDNETLLVKQNEELGLYER